MKVKFVFEGTMDINAENKDKVREYIEKHVGLCMGGHIHTSLTDKEIPNWNFPIHADKYVSHIKLRK